MTESVGDLKCHSIETAVAATGHSAGANAAQKFPIVAAKYSP